MHILGSSFLFFPQIFFLNTHLSLPFKLTSQINPQPQSWSWFHNCPCKSISSLKARLERDAGHFLLWLLQPSEDPLSVLFIWPLSCLIVLALPSVFLFSVRIDGNILKAGACAFCFLPVSSTRVNTCYMIHVLPWEIGFYLREPHSLCECPQNSFVDAA